MEIASGYASYKRWSRLLPQDGSDSEQESIMSSSLQRSFLQANKNGYVGWLLYHCSSIGTKARKQQFYHTFVAHFYGLSRNGIDTISKFGFCQSIRSFDSTRKDILDQNVENLR